MLAGRSGLGRSCECRVAHVSAFLPSFLRVPSCRRESGSAKWGGEGRNGQNEWKWATDGPPPPAPRILSARSNTSGRLRALSRNLGPISPSRPPVQELPPADMTADLRGRTDGRTSGRHPSGESSLARHSSGGEGSERRGEGGRDGRVGVVRRRAAGGRAGEGGRGKRRMESAGLTEMNS